MDITFEFHHDGEGGPDVIEIRNATPPVIAMFQAVQDGRCRDDDILQFPFWVGGQYEPSGLFRVGRIRNIHMV